MPETSDLTNVQRLVHLAFRYDVTEEQRIRSELVKARRRAYEQELTLQAERVGCNRAGRLTTGEALKRIAEQSREDAASIVSTFNEALVSAIITIGKTNPRANRNYYASQLGKWETARNEWKLSQIAQYTEGTARSQAQADFYRLNGIGGEAELQPRTAKEPVCQGWINRGRIPLKEALANPSPYHPNCPHSFLIFPEKIKPGECGELWVGE